MQLKHNTSDIVLMLHGSLQWGRREVEEWHFLVDIYEATLKVFEECPEVRLTVQFGGQDLEWISHARPEFVDRVKALVDREQIEVAMGGYSHNFQGATPDVNVANLVYAQEICQKVFGVKAYGYWPAECMLNRGEPKALKDAGFEYSIFDSLNVRHSASREYTLTGSTFNLAGAFDERIVGLPLARYEDCARRGENAGILGYAQDPAFYTRGASIVLDRLARGGLSVEVGDWEHFDLREENTHEIHMGTSSIGSENKIDEVKIERFKEILAIVSQSGNRFITGRMALEKHSPKDSLELLDGRDYTKNDLTRLVDATAWHHCAKRGLSGRQDPHYMSDQESYSYSFAGAKALGHLNDLKKDFEVGYDPVVGTKNVLISFCSAHRSGGLAHTISQQLIDRVDNVIKPFDAAFGRLNTDDLKLFVPCPVPQGYWTIPVNVPDDVLSECYSIDDKKRSVSEAYVVRSPLDSVCFRRTHQLRIKGPLAAGCYSLSPMEWEPKSAPTLERSGSRHIISSGAKSICFDASVGGSMTNWIVDNFKPVVFAGNMEANTNWQDAPLLDEVEAKADYKVVPGGFELSFEFNMEEVPVVKKWFVGDDLEVCELSVEAKHRRFSYLSPFAYRLNSEEFDEQSQIEMIAEGCGEISTESVRAHGNVHHLGSELIGLQSGNGFFSIAVDRLVSSPILKRNPVTGAFVLMDSRPIDFGDNAYPYEFAWNPKLELSTRIFPGISSGMFATWQNIQLHPPILLLGDPVIHSPELEWTREYKHISEVNPYF